MTQPRSIIVLTEKTAETLRGLLVGTDYRILVPPARDLILEFIKQERPLALVVGNDLPQEDRHAFLETIWSQAADTPIIHLEGATGTAETAASFSLDSRSPHDLKMALSDLEALS